jgi:aspartate racemase
MLVVSWPTPFWTDRPIDHDAMRTRIAEGLRWLDRCGVEFIAMPANLPQLYFDSLAHEVPTPLLNLVEAVGEALPAKPGPVAVVATRPVRDAGRLGRRLDLLCDQPR